MNRRTFLALLSLPLAAEVLQACGSGSASNVTTPTTPTTPGTDDEGTATMLQSRAPRVEAALTDAMAATTAVNRFGADLLDRLVAAGPKTNLVFSPASIAIALAMTSAGATGTTLTQMDAVLHVADPVAIHRAMNALETALAARNRTEELNGETATVQLSLVNSLWGQTGLDIERTFLDLLATEYGAGMHLVDYEHDPDAARNAINTWVDDATAHRIPTLLAPGTITTESRLTLVNAVHLKAPWTQPFTESLTTTEPFTTAAGDTVRVPMMHLQSTLAHAAGDGWQAVELSYAFDDLAMLLVVSDAGTTAALPPLDDVAGALQHTKVRLGLPRFDIGSSTSLRALLPAMGMVDAFGDDADFTGITTEIPLEISDVVHQANITVDESGTEAAAATAVVMMAGAAPGPAPEPIVLTIDRPFVFALRDRETGVITFLGRVADPSVR